MKGYRTYFGLIIALLGIVGLGDVITLDQLNQSIDLAIALSGIIYAAYGRFKAIK